MPYASLSWLNQTYGYDSLNRLASVSDSGGYSRAYGYDAYGNLWATAASGGPWSGSTPVGNVFNGANQMGGQSYDAAGNQLVVNGNSAAYDAENRMTSVRSSRDAPKRWKKRRSMPLAFK